jgi:hypothetical protein
MSVGIATRLRAGRSVRSGLDSRRELGIFLLVTASRPALGLTQLPIQCIPRVVLSPEVKWPGREAERSPPSSTEVNNTWSYTSTPHTPSRLSA